MEDLLFKFCNYDFSKILHVIQYNMSTCLTQNYATSEGHVETIIPIPHWDSKTLH